MFDSLTDLVEHYKRSFIEEVNGTKVYLKHVRTYTHTNDFDVILCNIELTQ